MNPTVDHRPFMRHALRLARRNLGQTWPNPAVGAVVVKNNEVLGVGWTAIGGRPHAETQALEMAGEGARGATLYVSLEPCSHQGHTPPCTEAIIAAGIAQVVIACGDSHSKVNGQGIARLREAGIAVVENVCKAEAEALNTGFFSNVARKRPHVAIKIASSLDGKITDPRSQWLTSEASRAYGHVLRSEYDLILTGIETVLADDPLLTCRVAGLEERSPVRLVLDRKNRLPAKSKLVQTRGAVPLWVENDTTDLPALLHRLCKRGVTRVLVEAGGTLNNAFLKQNLVDKVYWFRAPFLVGAQGMPAMDLLTDGWAHEKTVSLGPDSLEIFTIPAI